MDTLNNLSCTLIAIHLLITLIWIITFIIADELNQINPWSKDSLKMDKLNLNISIIWIITFIIMIISMLITSVDTLILLMFNLLFWGILIAIIKAIRWLIRKIYKEK